MPQYLVMPEPFKILAYVDNIPAMACCKKCQRKFFALRTIFQGDPVGAEYYLRDKFAEHQCSVDHYSVNS